MTVAKGLPILQNPHRKISKVQGEGATEGRMAHPRAFGAPALTRLATLAKLTPTGGDIGAQENQAMIRHENDRLRHFIFLDTSCPGD
jgi:hypothetical protein